MKKLLTALLVLLFATNVQAQDWDFGGDSYESKRNNFGLELGVGGTGEFSVDLGLRWQMNLHEFLSWDVLTVKGQVAPKYFSESILAKMTTGVHLNSPQVMGISAYLLSRFGYGYWFDGETGGFTYEIGAGLNVTRNIYVGYTFDNQKIDEDKIKFNGFRLGFLF